MIFAAITKVNEAKRIVTGRAVQGDVIDKSGEVFDYESSKPYFEQWSADVAAATGGRSLGNVRSMHGNVAAGKLVDIQFDDHDKAIDVAARIIDDEEWQKVLEGVHSGFSIGGRYIKRWPDNIDGQMVQRYTAVPTEISLVDQPCVPTRGSSTYTNAMAACSALHSSIRGRSICLSHVTTTTAAGALLPA